MTRTARRLAALALAAVVLAGCRVDVRVDVVSDEEGRGTVRVVAVLDGEAARAVGGASELRVDDLVAAGWVVDAPVATEDDGLVLVAAKPFGSPDQLREVLAEVSGPDGPYADLTLEIDRPFARTEVRLVGRLDGSVGVEPFLDPDVAALLGGLPLGRPIEEIESDIGAPIGTAVGLELGVSLPGGVTRAPGADPAGTALPVDPVAGAPDAVWRTDLAADEPVPVLATGQVRRWAPVALVFGALGSLALAVLVLAFALVVGLRRRRRRRVAARRAAESPSAGPPSPSPPPVGGAVPRGRARGAPRPAPPASGEPGAGTEPAAVPPPLELVILGAPGVVFSVVDEVGERLVPFVRARGGELDDDAIAGAHAAAIAGELSTAELWSTLGIAGDPAVLDEEYLGSFQLAPGLREFAGRARDRGYSVAAVVDAPAAWAQILRTVFRLGDVLDPWVTSADAGARPPDGGLVEAARRIVGVPAASCLVIDSSREMLDAAHAAGFGTAWCTATGRSVDAPGHGIVRGLEGLLGG